VHEFTDELVEGAEFFRVNHTGEPFELRHRQMAPVLPAPITATRCVMLVSFLPVRGPLGMAFTFARETYWSTHAA
jgi:hypothetical protein